MSADVEQRIFIVGAPRTGTTLLQSLLAAHSRVTSFTESHFFSRSFRALPDLSSAVLLRDPLPQFREFLTKNQAGSAFAEAEDRLRQSTTPGWLRPLRTKQVAMIFLNTLDRLALDRKRPIWIEKTPRHLRFTPFIGRISSTPARFVHLIRDGVDVVSSLHRASQDWDRPYGLDECVRRWNSDVAFSLERAESRFDFLVLYEQLTRDPEAVMRRLSAALSLDWQPSILTDFVAESARLTTPDETWKETRSEIRPSEASKNGLDGDQREQVRRTLRNDLYRRAEQVSI